MLLYIQSNLNIFLLVQKKNFLINLILIVYFFLKEYKVFFFKKQKHFMILRSPFHFKVAKSLYTINKYYIGLFIVNQYRFMKIFFFLCFKKVFFLKKSIRFLF